MPSATIPTVEDVVAACTKNESSGTTSFSSSGGGGGGGATTAIAAILARLLDVCRAPSAAAGSGAAAAAAAAEATNVLTGSLETLLRQRDDASPTVSTSAPAWSVVACDNYHSAFCTAVWCLSCTPNAPPETASQSLSANATFVAAVKAVLEVSRRRAATTQLGATTSTTSTSTSTLAQSLFATVADCALLRAVGVLDAAAAADLPRKLRVMNTTVNYRQYKFNLLSEETEGYSKLLFFLQQPPPPPPRRTTTARSSWHVDAPQTLRVLIGTYSLDPNRCLDVAVDALEYELYKVGTADGPAASAGAAHALLVDCFVAPARTAKHGGGDNDDDDDDDDTRRSPQRLQFLCQCIQALSVTTKLPPLLGFKLRGRSAMAAAPAAPNVPSLLYCMAWLCVQSGGRGGGFDAAGGFIATTTTSTPTTLLDPVAMTPYLPFDDDDGDAVDTTDLIDSLCAEKIRVERARVEALGRVRLTSAAATDPNEATRGVVDLSPLENRLVMQWWQVFLHGGLFARIQPILTAQQWSDLAFLFPDTVGTAILDGVLAKVSCYMPADSSPWSSARDGDGDAMDSDRTTTVTEVLAAIAEPLAFTMESGCIVLRPVLYCQLCRLLAMLLQQEKGQVIPTALVTFLRTFLVPSLSVYKPSPALSMELWAVLQELPYRTRYSLYGAWRGGGLERSSLQTDKPLWLTEGELLVGKDARYALKRLSKDTIRDMSRAVAKCCHMHPLVVFTTILNQIEAYDNLVQVMVDSCRFVTPLSLDVLGFCILQRLSGSLGGSVNRSRLKENGVNVSQWLQSLEAFTGAFYKRYPHVEFQGILCYLLQRLRDGHVMELGVLRTLLKSCAGWGFADYAPVASLSATQLDGRAGSTRLKRETMTFGVVSDINLPASNEVRRVLQNDNVGVSLLILLAQVRHQIVFQSQSDRAMPVKLIGNLVDTSQVVMAILLDFLTNEVEIDGGELGPNSAAIKKFAASLPAMAELHDSYKLDTPSTLMLCRPLIRAAVFSDDGDKSLSPFKSTDSTRFREMSPASTWTHLSTDLFECFFANSLFDIFCPGDVYVSEVARLDKEAERLSHKKSGPVPTSVQPGAPPEKSDKEELERVRNVASGLTADYSNQKIHVASIHGELASKTGHFFLSDQVSASAALTFFVNCVYPRCMQGPDDALFCAHFVSLLHTNATPGFSTLHFFDALITILSRSLYCLTEGEAACASILLTETWRKVSKWRYDDGAFESELAGKPGAFMIVATVDGEKGPMAVSKKDYVQLYNKWHAAIGATVVGCLQSPEYMHVRSSLVLLTRMVDEYPTRPKLANKLLQILEPLQKESNAFADIRASSQAYSMQLLRSRDNGVWKEEDAATVQARHAKIEAAAAERFKKGEEQMAQLMRDSDKITEEIGVGDSRDRSRGRGQQGSRFEPAPPDVRRRPLPQPQGATDDHRDGPRPTPLPRDTTQNAPPLADRRQRDRDQAAGSYTSIAAEPKGGSRREELPARGRPQDDTEQSGTGRNLEGRWQHAPDKSPPPVAATVAANRKRSRPSSPDEQGEAREEPVAPKRPRTNTEEDAGRGDDEGDRRRQSDGSIGRRRPRSGGRR